MAGMDRAGTVELPCELYAHRNGGLLYLLEGFLLLFAFELIFYRHEMNGDFFIRRLALYYRLQKFHEIARLVKQADVRVSNRDRGRAMEIRAQKRIEADPFLVLLEREVFFPEGGLRRHRKF